MASPGPLVPGMMAPGRVSPGPLAPGMTAPGMIAEPAPLLPQFGTRVVPIMRLSADDVRRYLAQTLTNQGFDNLKVGAVKEVDDTIAAELVTADGSIVQRFEVDRQTGEISRGK
jgi:hypothetical protein